MNQDVLTTAFMYGMFSYIYHQNQASVGTIPVPSFFIMGMGFLHSEKNQHASEEPVFSGVKIATRAPCIHQKKGHSNLRHFLFHIKKNLDPVCFG